MWTYCGIPVGAKCPCDRGIDYASAEAGRELYATFVKDDIVLTDAATAEMVKLMENTFRDVDIALANEVALICEAVEADVWRVRELVNKNPYRQMHLPGAGVGGHCITKDAWLLTYGASGKVPLRLISAPRVVNDSMPLHMAEFTVQALEAAGRWKALARTRIVLVIAVIFYCASPWMPDGLFPFAV